MPTARAKTFRSGNSEAIRIPRDLAFGDGVELALVRSGDVLTIYPVKTDIAVMIERLRAAPAVEIERRDEDDIPERPGL